MTSGEKEVDEERMAIRAADGLDPVTGEPISHCDQAVLRAAGDVELGALLKNHAVTIEAHGHRFVMVNDREDHAAWEDRGIVFRESELLELHRQSGGRSMSKSRVEAIAKIKATFPGSSVVRSDSEWDEADTRRMVNKAVEIRAEKHRPGGFNAGEFHKFDVDLAKAFEAKDRPEVRRLCVDYANKKNSR